MARGSEKRGKRRIVGGVDTHSDAHHGVVEVMNGGRVAVAQFSATAAGYGQVPAWLCGFGPIHTVGIEGTGCYGVGLARYLRGQGVEVIEVNRPRPPPTPHQSPSPDPPAAYAAADAVLAGRARALSKGGDRSPNRPASCT